MDKLSGELRVQADRIKEPLAAEVVINKTSALLRDAASLIDQQEKALEAADELARHYDIDSAPEKTLDAYRSARATETRADATSTKEGRDEQ